MNRHSDPNSLIPENPLLVYPSLAATIGLEEATMLSALTALARSRDGQSNNGFTWYHLDQSNAAQLMPFWQPIDIQRVAANLREQGLLLLASAPFAQSGQLKFAFNERAHRQPRPTQTSTQARNIGSNAMTDPLSSTKNHIAPSWQPDRDTLSRLAQHNIPSEFALQHVPEFVNYWRERGDTAHAWGSKFFQLVLRKWREFESQQNARGRETAMPRNWRPSEDAMEVLNKHAGISRQFIEDAIPEFELYWREQGKTSDNWNKKFRDHVHRQWLRYCSALEHDTVPRRIAENWKPSHDVYEVLRLANIDIPFAQSLIPEFVIYWRDSNQVHSSWNTRFLQYVKQRWAKRGHDADPQQSKSTRELSLAEQLTDRSWAL